MKTIVKTTRFPDADPEDRNHCALFALHALTGWSYETCAELAATFAGRKRGNGTNVFKLFGKGVRQFHEFEFLYAGPDTLRALFDGELPTVAQFANRKTTHNYFVVTNCGPGAHAIAVKRGVVFDNWTERHVRRRVLYYWRVTRKTVDAGLSSRAS